MAMMTVIVKELFLYKTFTIVVYFVGVCGEYFRQNNQTRMSIFIKVNIVV